MSDIPVDAVAFYSDDAERFHQSYAADANRRERIAVWGRFIDRYAPGATFAYDLGCGSGILACELARRGVQTLGVDAAPGMLAIARRSAVAAGLQQRVQFLERRLPIENPAQWPAADLVISSSALEYLSSLPDAFASIRDLMQPGGVLIFSVSNRQSLSRAIVRAVHRWTGRPRYFGLLKQFRTPDTLRKELAAAGLDVVGQAHFAKADRLNRLLGLLLPDCWASNMIIMAARRPADAAGKLA